MSRRIIIVDDEPGVRSALGQLLEYEGYEVKAVSSAADGIAEYEKWRPFPDRFFGTVLTLPRKVGELYSSDEQQQLLTVCRRIGMDYGEIDVLRDPRRSAR